jgi:hypothetical protein
MLKEALTLKKPLGKALEKELRRVVKALDWKIGFEK